MSDGAVETEKVGLVEGKTGGGDGPTEFSRGDMGKGGPLRPKTVIARDNQDIASLPRVCMKMVTADIRAFSSLMYGLRDLVGDVRMVISPAGVCIYEMIANNNILVVMNIPPSAWEFFEYEGEEASIVCFEPRHMYDCISKHKEPSKIMQISIDPNVDAKGRRKRLGPDEEPVADFMRVTIVGQSTDKEANLDIDMRFDFRIPLLRAMNQPLRARPEPLDYFLALDTASLNATIDLFAALEREVGNRRVMIECTGRQLSLGMRGGAGASIPKMRYVILHRDDVDEDDDDENNNDNSAPPRRKRPRTEGDDMDFITEDVPRKSASEHVRTCVSLACLVRLRKCFSINSGFVLVKLLRDYPVTFEVLVGSLGQMYITVNRLPDHDSTDVDEREEGEEEQARNSKKADQEESDDEDEDEIDTDYGDYDDEQ